MSLAIPRIYLTGRLALEHGERLVAESALPGRQGRLVFAFMTLNRHRAVGRGEVVDVVWPGDPPPEVDAALSALLSKLRAVFRAAGWPPAEAGIDVRPGSMALRLPPDTWIDVEAAAGAIDEAEGALRIGDAARAWGCANVAVSIARRPFLPDHDAPWIEARRTSQRMLLTRALECLAKASDACGDPTLGIQYTAEVFELEPFRETAFRQLMRLHASMGNRAEALRVFERCRQLLRDELGADPSPETEAVFLGILRA